MQALSASQAADPSVVIAFARAWIGTPYLHQASTRGAGADCLGLARGIWRELQGSEPFAVPAYTRDWGEVGGREVLLEAASRFLIEVPVDQAGPGALLLFRMGPSVPAKHCGLLAASDGSGPDPLSLIHAYDRTAVIEEPFKRLWQRRAAFAFLYPAAPDLAVPSPTVLCREAL